MKRGQAEIIGLVLIVLLLAIGFMLYVKFGLNADDDSSRASYEQTQLGATFVNSLAKAQLHCGTSSKPYAVEELVKEIAMGTTRCDAEDALTAYLNAPGTGVLNKTLDEWGVNYRLLFVKKSKNGESGIGLPEFNNTNIPVDQRCSPRRDRVADAYLVPLAPVPGTVEIRLEQCAG